MLRQPVRTLFGRTITSTLSASETFTLGQYDFDALVVKVSNSTWATPSNGTLNVYLQTSDDGFTTAYDVLAVGTLSAAITNAAALFYTIPVNIGDGKAITNITNSATSGYVGTVSGLPLLGNSMRVVYNFQNLTSTSSVGLSFSVLAQNQSPHA